jgi:valacyclovir hydrolase
VPRIDIGDQELHYIEQGSGDTLVLFPDNLHASPAHVGELDHFSDRFHVLSFDYPGTGRSTREIRYQDEQQLDLWNCRADLACHLLLELGIDACTVMGTGEGALVALHFAGRQARLHRLVARAVVADSFLGRLGTRTLHRRLDAREHYYVRNAERLKEQHGPDWREVVDADTSFLRGLADRGGYDLPDSVLNSITCPVLLTGNLHDALTPGIAQEYARISALVPDCSLFLASRSGHPHGHEHPLMWTGRVWFQEVCDLFLSRTGITA